MKATEHPIEEGHDVTKISRIRKIEEGLASLTRELEAVKKWPTEPKANLSVIRFVKTFGRTGNEYSYAAIKVDGRWYLTGRSPGLGSMTWDELMTFRGDSEHPIVRANSWVGLSTKDGW